MSNQINGLKNKSIYQINYDKNFKGYRFWNYNKPDFNDLETYFFTYDIKNNLKLDIV